MFFRFSTFVILLFPFQLPATECVDVNFRFPHLSFTLCQNHSNYNETCALLFRARAGSLNQLIEELIKQGRLEDKPFVISLFDPILTSNHLCLSKGPSGAHIYGSGFLPFEELAALINYFAQPDWKSYVYDPFSVANPEATRDKLMKIVFSYTQPDISNYIRSDTAIWRAADLALHYAGDSLAYYETGKRLDYKTDANLPVSLKNRNLFFEGTRILVRENGVEINSFTIPVYESEDYIIFTTKDWVNIGWGHDTDSIIYTYSYSQNRFYDLRKNKGK
jgi:hypothetical protein